MRKVWLVVGPGVACPGWEIGRAWLPWMRKVAYRDFDWSCRTTSAWPSQLIDRE